jgi:YVTN family beta-propeller protein
MHLFRRARMPVVIGTLGCSAALLLVLAASQLPATFAPRRVHAAFNRATTSSPIVVSNDDSLVLSVNPDDDSVSVINTATNQLATANVRVGDEPRAIAIDPDGTFAYVANAASNSVSVLQIQQNPLRLRVEKTIITGAEPWSVVISPDGRRVYVANAGQNTISVLDTQTRTSIGDVDLRSSLCNVGDQERHFQPRGLAVSADNTKLFVARTFSFTKAGGKQADDQGKEGIVCRLSINTAANGVGTTVDGPVALQPMNTGFAIDSSVPPDGVADPTFAYPNQLQSVVVRGNQAYVPNIAASPSGPLRFNVDTHAFVSVIDNIAAPAASGMTDAQAKALNLHLGARVPEASKKRLFFANPWAIAFTTQSGPGAAYVVSAGSDLLVKVNVGADGALAFTGGVSTTKYIDLNEGPNSPTAGERAGKNPLGIAMNAAGTKAYVMNFVSRNVSVVDTASDTVSAVVKTTDLPPAGSLDETLLAGAEVFFASRGHFDGGKSERLSSEGWQNCASCHFAGLTDANIWQFNTGPRKSVPLNSTWDPRNPDDQRILNYSGIFDEVQDFEINIRTISGPGFLDPPTNTVQDPNHGLLIGDDGNINAAPSAVVNAFARPNGGRPQLTLTLPGQGRSGIPALDAMKEWVRFAVRTPNGPLTQNQLGAGRQGPSAQTVEAGRRVFVQAGCQSCHGGGKWTESTKDFVAPPAAADVFSERTPLITGTNPVGNPFLDRFLRDIGSFNLNVGGQNNILPGSQPIGGIEKATGGAQDALGKDFNNDGKGNGYNVPSLLGAFASPPYYHNGACETLSCVLSNIRHRTSGLRPGQSDPLQSEQARQQLVAFLESIDAETQPAINLSLRRHDIASDPQAIFVGTPVTLTANIQLAGPRVPQFDTPLTVSFFDGEPGRGGVKIGDAQLSGVPTDNGQVRVSVPFTPPATPGLRRIVVVVDANNLLSESSERDNLASRELLVRALPGDRTRPVITDAKINNDAVATNNRSVTITIDAQDPQSPAPAPTSGLKEACVTSYFFNDGTRQWVPQRCTFKPLTGNSPFTLQETLPERDGVLYAFVVVRDAAGNLSRPEFTFINFVKDGPVDLAQNKTRVFRITLDAGQAASFTATPQFGDVDLSVFRLSDRERVAVSAQTGTATETVNFTAGATSTVFQVEVRAFATSRFTLAVGGGGTARAIDLAQANVIDAGREVAETPLVSAPPALDAAFEDFNQTRALPLVAR